VSDIVGVSVSGSGASVDEAAARARLEALFGRIDRLIPDDLAHVGLAADAHAARDGSRAVAEAAVGAAGLGELAREARRTARDRLLERWSGGQYRPTWVGALNWGVSTGRAADRAEVIDAIEDAALAAVAEGLVPDDVVVGLASDAEAVLALAIGGPAEESLATAVHAAAALRSPAGAVLLVVVVLLILFSSIIILGAEWLVGSLAAGAVLAVALAVAVGWGIRQARRSPRGGTDAP
jgi:hypothetical protein